MRIQTVQTKNFIFSKTKKMNVFVKNYQSMMLEKLMFLNQKQNEKCDFYVQISVKKFVVYVLQNYMVIMINSYYAIHEF